jgi:hypothetical protein
LERINRTLKIRKTYRRCLTRMRGFDGLSSHYRTSCAKTAPIKSSTTSPSAPVQSGADIELRAANQLTARSRRRFSQPRRRLFVTAYCESRRQKATWPDGKIPCLQGICMETGAISTGSPAWESCSNCEIPVRSFPICATPLFARRVFQSCGEGRAGLPSSRSAGIVLLAETGVQQQFLQISGAAAAGDGERDRNNPLISLVGLPGLEPGTRPL